MVTFEASNLSGITLSPDMSPNSVRVLTRLGSVVTREVMKKSKSSEKEEALGMCLTTNNAQYIRNFLTSYG